ncbi:hypothetical protein BC828DRAFT_82422 [Blastocladiella britannica]|nr:hypothetical protein BC828DRAFT_82422 [Blastocladiella britannica]
MAVLWYSIAAVKTGGMAVLVVVVVVVADFRKRENYFVGIFLVPSLLTLSQACLNPHGSGPRSMRYECQMKIGGRGGTFVKGY